MPDYSFLARHPDTNGLRPIADMLGIASSAQSLQAGNLDLQRKGETLQANIERAKAESSLSQTEADVARQTAQPRITKAETEAKQEQFNLARKQAETAYNEVAGLFSNPSVRSGDPRGSVKALADAHKRAVAKGVPDDIAMMIFGGLSAKAQKPGELSKSIQDIIQAQAGPQSQSGVINAPVTIFNQGRQAVPIQTQPNAPGGMPPTPLSGVQGPLSIPMQTSPEHAERTGQDIFGRPMIETRSPAGEVGYKPPPGSNYRPIMALPPDMTPEAGKQLGAMVATAPEELKRVAGERFNNQQILHLAPEAFTGTGSTQLARVLNTVGINTKNDIGADTAALKHFLAMQVQNNAKEMGASTDAARQLAERAVLPGEAPEKAIKSITKINDAYAMGRELYYRGMLKAVNDPDNKKDILAAREFQTAWAQNFDPNVMRLMRGDKEEVRRELGPDGLKSLLTKYRNLKALSESGRLP